MEYVTGSLSPPPPPPSAPHPVPLQFWNCYVKKRFLSYDYGPRANLRIYGTVLNIPLRATP